MLTILSTPKAFTGLFAVIQRNAIESWTKLEPRPEIILFGRDPGTAEICDELGPASCARRRDERARHSAAQRHVHDGSGRWRPTPWCAGRMPTSSSAPTVMRAAQIVTDHPRPAYLVGRRTDIDQLAPLDFFDGWSEQLVARPRREGERKPANWIDYFMFTRGLFVELPPFAIGRPGYDPWLIWRAADLGADVIDATDYVLAVHQRHDYSHVGSRAAVFGGVEARENAAIVDDWRHYHSIGHARLKLDSTGQLVPPAEPRTAWLAPGPTPRICCASPARSVVSCSASKPPVAGPRSRALARLRVREPSGGRLRPGAGVACCQRTTRHVGRADWRAVGDRRE